MLLVHKRVDANFTKVLLVCILLAQNYCVPINVYSYHMIKVENAYTVDQPQRNRSLFVVCIPSVSTLHGYIVSLRSSLAGPGIQERTRSDQRQTGRGSDT